MLVFSKCNGRGTCDQPPSTVSDTKALQNEQARILEIHQLFVKGVYDSVIFNEAPQLTEELQIIIAHYNREFIQRLFTKCNSQKALEFWLQEAGAKLPEDTWALAVNLGNNIFVLKYLKENGWFDDLSKDDMTGLLSRAERFKSEGLEYLKVQSERKSGLTF